MIGSNVFALAFGRNLDAHAPSSPSNSTLIDTAAAGPAAAAQCLDGRACYIDSLKLTIVACCIALVLSVYTGWRDRQRQLHISLKGAEGAAEVVWEE